MVFFVLLALICEGSEKEEEALDPIDLEDHEVISRPHNTDITPAEPSKRTSRKRNKRRKRTRKAPETEDEDSFDSDLAPVPDEHEEQEDEAAVLRDAGPSPLHVDFVVLPKAKGDRYSKAAAPTTHEMASRDVLDRLVFRNG